MERHMTAERQKEKVDLVVIGAGGAGLAAAMSATEMGLKRVIVLEKLEAPGGNTNMSSGMFAAESPAQKRQAIDARNDDFFKTLTDFSHWKVNPRIVRAFIDKSGDTIRWLEKKGLHFICHPMYPNQIPTWHQASKNRGAEMVQVMVKACLDAGVDIRVRTAAKQILIGDDGKVFGVEADHWGETYIIQTDNVIIASGGFGGNKMLLKKHCPGYHENMLCDGMLHTGDGLNMALEVGAATEGLGVMLMSGPQIPNAIGLYLGDGEDRFVAPLMALALEPNTLWVNKNGERFADEALGFNHYVSSNAVNRQPDNLCFTILDQGLVDAMTEKGLIIGLTGTRVQQRSAMPGLTRELERQAIGFMSVQQSDWEVCNGCGTCVATCPVGAIRLDTLAEEIGEASACSDACPVGVNTRRYVHLIKQEKLEEAYSVLREYAPLPAVTGRVCPHVCESACERNQVDEPVNVHSLERFLADWGRDIQPEPIIEHHSETVAVVGSGPAGLSCAYFLARYGYGVTVFEASDKPGGMLRTAIPEYRLPQKVLDNQIDYIRSMGVDIKTGIEVGNDITMEKMRSDFDAVFFATGNQLSRSIDLEKIDLEGIDWGLSFLQAAKAKKEKKITGKVVVIGGGNVAVDVGMTALRLGADEVHMASLECGEELPAFAEEIRRARQEGVVVHEGWGPAGIKGNGRVAGIDLVRCEAVCDPDGNFNPSFDPTDTKTLAADRLIFAIGQMPDTATCSDGLKLAVNGTVCVDHITMETTMPGVFAGGDVTGKSTTVAQAIADGKTAAVSIHRYLHGEDLTQDRLQKPPKVTNPPGRGIDPAPRLEPTMTPPKITRDDFSEIDKGLSMEDAGREAQRCMTCGSRSVISYVDDCRQCRTCAAACPVEAISPQPIKRIEPYVRISDSLDELAHWMGADPDVFSETIEDYNNCCERGRDGLFAKDPAYLVPLKRPPYYAIRANSDFLDTIGGIRINHRMQVLDTEDTPIPGLYAAGVIAGGWQYDTYCVILSGAASGFAVNSGRIAGETIARKIKAQKKSMDKS
jgi:NADPH-dependent glutamate synthase beta subunit-like oxidoreductase